MQMNERLTSQISDSGKAIARPSIHSYFFIIKSLIVEELLSNYVFLKKSQRNFIPNDLEQIWRYTSHQEYSLKIADFKITSIFGDIFLSHIISIT